MFFFIYDIQNVLNYKQLFLVIKSAVRDLLHHFIRGGPVLCGSWIIESPF